MSKLSCRRRHSSLLTFVAMTLLAAGVAAGAPSDLIKTTDWLQANMTRPDVRIVDLRQGIEYYWQAHVPGAVHLYPDALTWPENGVPSKPLPPQMFADLLGNMGITDTTTVVVYSEVIDSLSPYLTWMLDYVGHKRQALIAGEFDQWRKEGRPLTQDYPKNPATVYRLPAKLNEGVRVSTGRRQGGAWRQEDRHPRCALSGHVQRRRRLHEAARAHSRRHQPPVAARPHR